jgi:hypothetical protein
LRINLKDLEKMVDSSLSVADSVIIDDQSVKGELWLYRNAVWVYHPYTIQIVYHVYNGEPTVIIFKSKLECSDKWEKLVDTDSYRKLLNKAESWRRRQVS